MSKSSLSTTFDQSSFIAAIFYSILATAGLFYVNLGGAFLSAFVDGLGVERDIAGFIVSANKYGAAFGALIATFIVKNVEWRKAVRLLFIGLIVFDLISTQITNPNILILVRFIHGTIGGLSVGIGLSIIARTYNPDKIFGIADKNIDPDEEIVSLSEKIDPEDDVSVDGERISKKINKKIYIILNKPKGIVCTTDSSVEKDNIIDYINYPKRIFPIGRLDKTSEGLIFLTNDGDIVNKILRAKNNHEKEYHVTVDKPINNDFVKKMSKGVPILNTVTRPVSYTHLTLPTILLV